MSSSKYKENLETERRLREDCEREKNELKEKLAKLEKELETLKLKDALENGNEKLQQTKSEGQTEKEISDKENQLKSKFKYILE